MSFRTDVGYRAGAPGTPQDRRAQWPAEGPRPLAYRRTLAERRPRNAHACRPVSSPAAIPVIVMDPMSVFVAGSQWPRRPSAQVVTATQQVDAGARRSAIWPPLQYGHRCNVAACALWPPLQYGHYDRRCNMATCTTWRSRKSMLCVCARAHRPHWPPVPQEMTATTV